MLREIEWQVTTGLRQYETLNIPSKIKSAKTEEGTHVDKATVCLLRAFPLSPWVYLPTYPSSGIAVHDSRILFEHVCKFCFELIFGLADLKPENAGEEN
jgi:hypothetical protein